MYVQLHKTLCFHNPTYVQAFFGGRCVMIRGSVLQCGAHCTRGDRFPLLCPVCVDTLQVPFPTEWTTSGQAYALEEELAKLPGIRDTQRHSQLKQEQQKEDKRRSKQQKMK